MAKTRDQLRDRAAQNLGIVAVGQALQNQHKVRVEDAIDEVYQSLKEKGLATWASDAGVPDEIMPWVSGLVELNCLDTYGVSSERFGRIVGKHGIDGNRAERNIRELVTQEYVSQDHPVDF